MTGHVVFATLLLVFWKVEQRLYNTRVSTLFAPGAGGTIDSWSDHAGMSILYL